MANIGNLAVLVTANAVRLKEGLAAASSAVSGFVASTAAKMQGLYSKTGVSALTGGLLGGIKGAFAAAGGALLAGIGLNPSFWKDAQEKIKTLGMEGLKANSIGLLSEQYMGLAINAKRFGVEGDALLKVLFKFSATGKGGTVYQNLLDFADQVAAIKDPGERAALVMDRFGKAGYTMLPILAMGSKGIEEFTQKQIGLGRAISQADMDKLIAARAALPKWAAAFEGFNNKMLIAFAPILTLFSKTLEENITPGLTKLLDVVSRGVAVALDITGTYFGELLPWVGDLIAGLFGIKGGFEKWMEYMPDVEDVVIGVFESIGQVGGWVFDTIKAGVGLNMIQLGSLAQSLGQVLEMAAANKELLGGIASAAMGPLLGAGYKAVLGMAGPAGAAAKAFGTSMVKAGLEMAWAFGSSQQAVDDFFFRWKGRDDEMRKAARETGEVLRLAYQPTAALVMGSREAYSAEIAHRFAGGQDNAQQEAQKALKGMDETLKDILRETRKQSDALTRMRGL